MNPEGVLVDGAKPRFVNVSEVLDFVSRTVEHGAPVRIAISRAASRFGIDPGLIRAFVRSGTP